MTEDFEAILKAGSEELAARTGPPSVAAGSDQACGVPRRWFPSASVTIVCIAPEDSVHGALTQRTSMTTGCSFGIDRATAATASSHFTSGTSVQAILGVAAGSAAPPQPTKRPAASSKPEPATRRRA